MRGAKGELKIESLGNNTLTIAGEVLYSMMLGQKLKIVLDEIEELDLVRFILSSKNEEFFISKYYDRKTLSLMFGIPYCALMISEGIGAEIRRKEADTVFYKLFGLTLKEMAENIQEALTEGAPLNVLAESFTDHSYTLWEKTIKKAEGENK